MDLDPFIPPGEINIADEDVKVEVKVRNSTGGNNGQKGDENNGNG